MRIERLWQPRSLKWAARLLALDPRLWLWARRVRRQPPKGLTRDEILERLRDSP